MDKLEQLRNELKQLQQKNIRLRRQVIMQYLAYPIVIATVLIAIFLLPKLSSLPIFTKLNSETEFIYSMVLDDGSLIGMVGLEYPDIEVESKETKNQISQEDVKNNFFNLYDLTYNEYKDKVRTKRKSSNQSSDDLIELYYENDILKHYYEITGGKCVVITGVKNKAVKNLTVPSTVEINGEEYQVVAIIGSLETYRLRTVVLPDTIRYIARAFEGCELLEEINLPKNLAYIGNSTFANCTNLSKVNMPKSTIYIGDIAFRSCNSLKEIELSPNLKMIESGAFEKSGLEKIKLPENVGSIGSYAFQGCIDLKEIELPDGLQYINQFAFVESGIEKIVIPGSVKNIFDGTFKNCLNLTSITFQEGVEEINESFEGCEKLTEVKLPSTVSVFQYNNYEKIVQIPWLKPNQDGMKIIGKTLIKYTGNEKKVIIPEYIQNIASNAFSGNKSLEEVVFPEGLISIENQAFYMCTNLDNVKLPDSVRQLGSEVFTGSAYYNRFLDDFIIEGGSLVAFTREVKEGSYIDIEIPDVVAHIGSGVFKDNHSIRSVRIPNTVRSINESAFQNCSNLRELDIAEGLVRIGYNAFSGCSSLTNVKLPETLTELEAQAFESCNLSSIVIGKNVDYIGTNAFRDNVNLKKVRLEANDVQLNSEEEDSIYSIFTGCENLREFEFGEEVRKIPDTFFSYLPMKSIKLPEGITEIGANAFFRCENLETITIPDSVTLIKDGTFASCSSLKTVNMSNNVTYIGRSAFAYCMNLTKITLSQELEFIDEDAFLGCSSLSKLSIPEKVDFIGNNAFRDCSSLEELLLPEQVKVLGVSMIANCNQLTQLAIPDNLNLIHESFLEGSSINKLYVPAEKMDFYTGLFAKYQLNMIPQ